MSVQWHTYADARAAADACARKIAALIEEALAGQELATLAVSGGSTPKLMFEKLLQWYRQIHGLEFVAFRYFNAAGASEKFGEHHRVETHLIPNILQVPLGRAKECQIYGTDYPTPDGTCIRDYIHIVDLAQAHMLALPPGKQGFYNLGNGDGYSVRQVIKMCEKITGSAIPVVEKTRRPGDPPKLVASAAKAISELGWKPTAPGLEQIVSDAWRWHQAHPDGYPD